MATGGQLRRKQGPIKTRLEDIIQVARQFLQQKLQADLPAHLFQCKSHEETVQNRLQAFQQVEDQLNEIIKTNADEEKKLSERDETYITVSLDAQETLSKLNLLQKEIENMIEAPE